MRLSVVLTFVAGIAAGSVATLLLLPDLGPVPAAPSTSLAAAKTTPEAELLRLQIALREKDADLAAARSELITLRHEHAARRTLEAERAMALAEAEKAEEAAREARREDRAEAFAQRIQERTDQELQQLVRIADLSPAQVTAVQQLLNERNARRVAAIQARREGTEVPSYEGLSFEESLAAVLSPAQVEAYEAYENSVLAARIETGATAQMNRIAPELMLNEGQKDQVYALFYDDLAARVRDDPSVPANSAAQREALLNAQMQQVLSPEQYSEWMASSASRDNPRRGGGRGGPPPFGP